jgi:hypothetical protein
MNINTQEHACTDPFAILFLFLTIPSAAMTNPRLTFGEMTVYGELARGVHPADELGLQMAMALGQPDPPSPPFATVPVLLDGHAIGWLSSIRYVWGGACYEFRSTSGNTNFCGTKEATLDRLQEVLQLAG